MTNRKWKISEALFWASSFLNTKTTAPELLLAHLLRLDRTQLLSNLRETCPDEIIEQFQELMTRHKLGVPVQYLIGEEHFYGRSFLVNKSVLIPRPETEELVQLMLQKMTARFYKKQTITGCDVGTGSGVIAITLACEAKKLEMTATDISKDALQVAKQNAERLNATNVTFVHGDLLYPVISKRNRFDIIVSNPPYIETNAISKLDVNVRAHEPHLALDGGKDGYAIYRKLIRQLPEVINEQAIIGFEVGVGQSKTVAALLHEQFPDANIETTVDINGKDRIVSAEIGFYR